MKSPCKPIDKFFALLSALFLFTAFCQTPAHANNDNPANTPATKSSHQGTFGFGIGWGWFFFDNSTNSGGGLDKRTGGFELYSSYDPSPATRLEIIYNQSTLGDENSFSTIAVGENGFIEFVESETKARMWTLTFSLRAGRSSNLEYRLGPGYTTIAVERKIQNCTSCNSDELELEDGGFIFGSVDYRINEGSRFSLTARHYLSGDLSNAILLHWKALMIR